MRVRIRQAMAATVAAAALLALPAGAQAANLFSGFDAGDEGWTIANNHPVNTSVFTTPEFVPSGGNPGGFIRTADAREPVVWEAVAPAAWNGNKGLNYGGTLSADVRHANPDFGPSVSIFASDVGSLFYNFDEEPVGWEHYSVELRETDERWTYYASGSTHASIPTKDEFISVLRNITDIGVLADLGVGTGDVGEIDNVGLLEPTSPIDSDADGTPDGVDLCPGVVGAVSHSGCAPPPDTDGDGVPDANDACPAVAGVAPTAGCPLPPINLGCEKAKVQLDQAREKLKQAKTKKQKAKAKVKVKKFKQRVEELCG